VLLYNCNDGSIIKQLKGHKDKIYSVSYSHDGSRIASGGADKSTIIWNEEGKGILKFTHADSLQVVSYSPVEDVLLSCSSSDFGFWSPQDKSVIKHKVDSKILCASWRNDGHVIALGLFSGKISLYNIHGDEIGAIARNAPVWSVSWNRYEYSSNDFTSDILAVGSWDMTLSFYDEFYQQLNEDQCLDYYPSSVAYYGRSSEYIIVGSSSGNLDLFSKDGIFLKNIGNHTGWIWCAKGVDEKQVFACVDSSGILAYYHLTDDEPIRDKWKECLAYRDSCTDVVVHDASMDRTRRIRCNDFVKAISLLQNEIAVAMRERIIIYDISSSIDECRVKHCIDTMMPFKLIKMTSNHIFICMEKKIIAYSTRGEMVREWNLRQNVLCIQNLCAIPGEESVLVGCQDGKVLVVAINSPFCTTLLKLKSPIVSIDVSCNSRYIGMICDGNNLVIFDQIKKSCVQDMKGPKSIFFHDEIECMYCYGNDGIVTIKDIHLRGFSQVESGRGCTVHFSGTQISYLQKDLTVHHIDINLTSLAYQKAKNRDFEDAFKIALLGSSHDFFTYLAKEALLNSNYSVSMKCYRHLDIPSMTEYVQRQRLKAPQDCTSPNDARVIIATDIALLENNFSEASDIFKKAGMSQKLIEYNVKMRKFEEAKEVLEKNDKTNYDFIIMKEAEWEEQMKNWKRASSLFLECKCYLKAVNLVGEFKGEGWIDAMCNLNQSIPNKEIEALKRCCHYLSGEEGLDETIKSILLRIKDYSSLMHLYVKNSLWIEIAQLCQQHEHDIDKCLMLPYADWLAVQARLNEALAIYRKADRQDKSIKLLLSLIDMSILEEDFKETSMLYRTLAKETQVKVSLSLVITNIFLFIFLS
jgi:intraflagellar transport protein 122